MRKDLLGPRARPMPRIEPFLYKWSVISLQIQTYIQEVSNGSSCNKRLLKISHMHRAFCEVSKNHIKRVSQLSLMKDN